jgi:hypothetical protein
LCKSTGAANIWLDELFAKEVVWRITYLGCSATFGTHFGIFSDGF